MAKLLTDADFLDIRTAINDVTETFCEKEFTYKQQAKSQISRFGRDVHNTAIAVDVVILGLVEYGTDAEDNYRNEKGQYDDSDGRILMGYDYLDSIGLIENENPIFNPSDEYIIIDGVEMEIIGCKPEGQLKDKNAIVYLYFKKQLKNGD